jgi:hypothetical protein
MHYVPILTVSYVPNLTPYDPNLTGMPNVPKIEQKTVFRTLSSSYKRRCGSNCTCQMRLQIIHIFKNVFNER